MPRIRFPIFPPRPVDRMIDTLLPRNPPIGIHALMRLRHLPMIHNGLSYPKMCYVTAHDPLRRLMRPYIFAQILHRLLLIPLADADTRSGLRHRGSSAH